MLEVLKQLVELKPVFRNILFCFLLMPSLKSWFWLQWPPGVCSNLRAVISPSAHCKQAQGLLWPALLCGKPWVCGAFVQRELDVQVPPLLGNLSNQLL